MEDFLRYPSGFEERIAWIKAVILFLVFIVFLRAVHLQVVEHEELSAMADRRTERLVSADTQRGRIIDADNKAIAVSIPRPSLFAYPEKITDHQKTAAVLTVALGEKYTADQFINESGFTWIKRYITKEQKNFIESQNLSGLHFTNEFARVYPRDSFAAQLVGITGYDSKGLDGLEYRFDDYLMGKGPDASSKEASTFYKGADVYLTISEKIQHFAEKAVRKSVLATHSKSGSAIVMESRTGAILAVASYPTFNPNDFSRYDPKLYVNRAVNSAYEPGSTFKMITLSIARQMQLIQSNSEFFCENGSYKVMDRFISDVNPYGVLGLKEIIQKSSNICSLKIGLGIPKEQFYEGIKSFGFGSKTGVDLPGESVGVLHDYRTWSKLDQAAISFGHSIQVSPIQLISAINTFANNGVYLSPYIISRISYPGSEENLYKLKQVSRKILDEAVAKEITQYMVSVTEKEGTGYAANIDGLSIAGKTGTTRKLLNDGKGYSSKHHIRSFVGFFPAEAPLLTILTILNEPREKYEDSLTAAPLFKEIALKSYRYFVKNRSETFSPPVSETNLATDLFKTVEAVSDNDNLKKKSLREALYYSSLSKKKLHAKGRGKVKAINSTDDKLIIQLD